MEAFFAWAGAEAKQQQARNVAASALGYAVNQELELRAVLKNAKLPLDNSRSERALRKIVTVRKSWMFHGSDIHAESAGAMLTLIATSRLHGIETRQYLDELMRVLPYWSNTRYLELAPQNWVATRARLDPKELAELIGHITVPELE